MHVGLGLLMNVGSAPHTSRGDVRGTTGFTSNLGALSVERIALFMPPDHNRGAPHAPLLFSSPFPPSVHTIETEHTYPCVLTVSLARAPQVRLLPR